MIQVVDANANRAIMNKLQSSPAAAPVLKVVLGIALGIVVDAKRILLVFVCGTKETDDAEGVIDEEDEVVAAEVIRELVVATEIGVEEERGSDATTELVAGKTTTDEDFCMPAPGPEIVAPVMLAQLLYGSMPLPEVNRTRPHW